MWTILTSIRGHHPSSLHNLSGKSESSHLTWQLQKDYVSWNYPCLALPCGSKHFGDIVTWRWTLTLTSYCFKLLASVCLYNTYSDIQRLSSENPAFFPSLNHSYPEFLLKHNFCRQFLNTGFNTLEFIKIVICCHSQYYDWDNYTSHDIYEVQPWRWQNISESLPIIRKKREAKGKEEKERYTHLNAEFQRIARRDN